MKVFIIVVVALVGLCSAQQQQERPQGRSVDREPLRPTTTPVPILRQINKVNEDGSYTYGYENADGSYKIETKDNKGQVNGKYGYYDNDGTLREIEYGASKSGFYPTGTDVNAPVVAPHRETDNEGPQDGSYDPEVYTYPYQHGYDGPGSILPAAPALQNQVQPSTQTGLVGPNGRRLRVKTGRRVQAAGRQLSLFQQNQPQQQYQQPQQQQYQQPQQQQYQQPQQQYQQPQQQYQPQYQQPQPQPNYYQPQPQAPHLSPAQHFQGHPARNIDLNTGSYSINYSG